ncbi:ion transporter [Halobacteriovorax sp. HLS]|uniref:ion transporter n=1 Tax=Halobacteriovorax sp. HLS TaxID=2234000 RepID=UPI000FDB9563|nr:ion transporter [Halobacteriovorax sp. HLS]
MKKSDKIQSFLENNVYYTAFLSILALVTGLESVFDFSFGKKFTHEYFDYGVFGIFAFDFLLKIIVYAREKFENSKIAFGGLFSIPFTFVDFIALVPDVISLIIGTQQIDLKALRALRALKLLRLTRVFSKNKRMFNYVLNFFRYKLYGQSLVFGANFAILFIFGSVFSFIHYEYSVYSDLIPSVRASINWGLNIFIDPYGSSYSESNSMLLKGVSLVGSTFGLFVYASIIGVFSNLYSGIFEIIDKGVGMTTIKKGDFVIIGWNHLIPSVAEHIVSANKQRVVLVTASDKSQVRKLFENVPGGADIFNNPLFEYVNTDYSSRDELERLNIWNAEKIVIVYDDNISGDLGDNYSSANARDAKILFTMKTIRGLVRQHNSKSRIVCEVFCKSNKHLFGEYSDVEIISKESLFSNVFSQSVAQDEILNVYKRLLKTEDKELYIVPFSDTSGSIGHDPKDYYDYQASYSRQGIGLVGLYFTSMKGGKAGVILSPSEAELEEAVAKYTLEQYVPSFILLAESPEELELFKKSYRKKAA